MKKLMKAIALATVMCMLMSVAAFASEATLVEGATKTLDITITGVGSGEQVSLLVVAPGTTTPDENNIYYVGQDVAANGQVTFEDINLSNVTGDTVEIWSGNATYAGANASAPIQKLTDIKLTAAVTKATVQIVGDVITATKKGAEQTGFGIGMNVNITVPEGYNLSKVIWAATVNGVRRYTDSITVGPLSGSTQLGVSFLNGSDKKDIDVATITEPAAIFLFVNGNDAENQEVFTDEQDAAESQRK